jgi:hypothetical protein
MCFKSRLFRCSSQVRKETRSFSTLNSAQRLTLSDPDNQLVSNNQQAVATSSNPPPGLRGDWELGKRSLHEHGAACRRDWMAGRRWETGVVRHGISAHPPEAEPPRPDKQATTYARHKRTWPRGWPEVHLWIY